jgi:hypothetical protein
MVGAGSRVEEPVAVRMAALEERVARLESGRIAGAD